MRTETASLTFWRDHAPTLGFAPIDRNLSRDENWEPALTGGAEVMAEAIAVTGMPIGPEISVLEIGCGIGRLVFALADSVGEVVGLDVSPRYLEAAIRRSRHRNVRFELIAGDRLAPRALPVADVVFSHEVFHYLDAGTIIDYIHDAYGLLRPGGMFWFEINLQPVPPRTYAAAAARLALHRAGVKTWRHWPTHPGFRRKLHSFEMLVRALVTAGFHLERVTEHRDNTWFVARRPAT